MDLRHQLQRTLGDGYTLERELEGGGMARVFVARDQQLGRQIVVKTLADDSGVSVSAERFRREIRLAASLQQANIVPVHSAGDVDGVPYYTMPFVEGESLRAHMDSRGALDPHEAVNILRDVARALAYAHERGVVHRDIKPENILLSGSTAVVTDFGIAKAIEASHSQAGATLTQLGTLLGTPAYISPEQAAGDPHVDHLADIYSLGVVAYEMLAGERPFAATTARALLAAHVNETPRPVVERRTGIPPRLASLVMRCLEKEPERRPQRATDLLSALESALAAGASPEVTTPEAGAAKTPVIAVLPLANLSASSDDEYFADGITEDIIAQLSQIASLRVISRTSVMQFKGTARRTQDVARDLRATHVVEGSVRRAGARLRVVTRLVEAVSESQVWTETFDREMVDVFAIQSEIAERVVAALKAQLTAAERTKLSKRPTENLEAYNLYLLGRHHFNQVSAESMSKGIDCYMRAIELDPKFARVHGALAMIHVYQGGGYWGTRPRDAYSKAVEFARLALAIDPDVSDAHEALGHFEQWIAYDWESARKHLERAIELNPRFAFHHIGYGMHLMTVGRLSDAVDSGRRALDLDPAALAIRGNMIWYLIAARRLDEALAELKISEQYYSHDAWTPILRMWSLVPLGRADEALAALEAMVARMPASWPMLMLATCHAAAGQPADARELLRALHDREASEYVWPVGFAITYAHLGEMDRAFAYLERAYEERAGTMNSIAVNPMFDPLRGDPRFDAIVARIRPVVTDETRRAFELTPARPGVRVARSAGVRPVIAVLPLTNMSASADDEYFADGMTEDIIAQLSQIASLRVISRASVMGYKKSAQKPREIAAELGASHTIEGSVRRAGNRVRIVAQLMDAKTEAHLWSETFDRDLTDIFAIQSELAQRIAVALVARLTPAEARRVAKRPTLDMEAYNLFLLGRQEYGKASPQAFARAEEYYDQAIARDPGFARAYAAKALVHMYHGGGYWGVKPTMAYERAVGLARKAIELDPDVGEAHMVLGAYESWITFDWDASARHFDRAIALNPSHAFSHIMRGWLLFATGKIDEAIQAGRLAIELDPVSPLVHANAISFSHVARRRTEFELGLAAARRLSATQGVDVIIRTFQAIAQGSAAEILPETREVAQGPDNIFLRALLGWCAAAAGEEYEARAILTELHALEKETYVWGTGFALIYANLGEADRAFEYLEKAYQDRAGWLNVLGTSPAFDPFRGDPRFDSLVKRVGVVVAPEVARQTFKPMPAPRRALAPATSGRKSVAVLPFANLSPDPENEFFADGITDDLIAQVAKIGSLRVIARTSVMRYRGAQDAARTAAKELGVSAVVEGTVRRAGKRARIVAQLIDTASDAPIWSETYDRDLDDVFSVQTEVATNVAQALKATLTPAEERRLARQATKDAKAYDLYLIGRHHYNRRTPESLKTAMAHFEQAIARDPQFAAAHAGLADAYVFAGIGYAPIPPVEAFAKAKASAQRALDIDAESPEALCAMGLASMHGDGDTSGSQRLFERAIAANPSYSVAHQFLAWCRFSFGDYIGATEPQRRALGLDPLNVSLITEQGWPYSYAALHDIAITHYRRAVEMDPGFGLGHYNIGIASHGMGRHAEAVAAYEQALATMGPSPWVLGSLAITLAASGDRSKAEQLLGNLRALTDTGAATSLAIAMAADALGQVDEALAALEHGRANREPFIWCIALEGWLEFRNSRGHPRFRALMELVGIPPHDIPRQRELLLAYAKQQGLA